MITISIYLIWVLPSWIYFLISFDKISITTTTTKNTTNNQEQIIDNILMIYAQL